MTAPVTTREPAKYEVRAGTPFPWGAQARGAGVNFSLFCRYATGMRLEFFAEPGAAEPSWAYDLDPARHRTGDGWHLWVGGVEDRQLYGYRATGPFAPERGFWFNPHRLLLDPCAYAVAAPMGWEFAPACQQLAATPVVHDDAGTMPKSVYCREQFDWGDDRPPRHAAADTVIYETHVRGCTMHPSAGVTKPGTYAGLTEKIPYFQSLGITALELMPVQEFNAADLTRVNPLDGRRLRNYWGYNPVAFFAPKAAYAADARGGQRSEFRRMVKAFHRAGIEILIDIVLNHSAEGDASGPTLCFRGLDNPIYYMLNDADPRQYRDFTGVGNTLNANHPVVREWIIQVLRTWVMDLHVDGFRFDLASVLGRDRHGAVLPNAPLLEQIAEDPILRETKLIAEAWDAGGAYLLGHFSERSWAEWNGRFRDDVRRFWRGDGGVAGLFASRLCGSADLFQGSGKGPGSSINFVTCHDGFTLRDTVSYATKHNQANGENNRDGVEANYSANYGIEGPTDNPSILAVRRRQVRNLLASLLLARGVPMLLGGDEFGRTQGGNNNAYCHDDETTWYDWRLAETNAGLVRFTRGLIDLRRRYPVLRREAFYAPDDIQWFGSAGGPPAWQDPERRSVGCLIFDASRPVLFLVFHPGPNPVRYRLPSADASWKLVIDTFRQPPEDYFEPGREPVLAGADDYEVGPQSTLILACGTSPMP